MKTTIFSKTNFTAVFVAAALFFGGCKNDMLEDDLKASSSKNVEVISGNLGVTISPNPVLVGQSVTITGTRTGLSGTLSLQEKISGSWVTVTNPLTINPAALADNGRQFRAYNVFTPSISAPSIINTSQVITLSVNAACTEFTLTPETVQATEGANNLWTFTTVYTIQTCDRAVNGIKLQGGLTAGATLVSTSPTGSSRSTRQNTIVSWDAGNMAANSTKVFTVEYTKTIAPLTCGEIHNVTGDWSAKGRYADDNSAAVAGYSNEQYLEGTCPEPD
jgi:hypothetical protein